MASKAAHKRLSKEYVVMQKEPPPFVWAVPDEKNILTWNFLIRGPPDSPFAGGEYHGMLMFPTEYPFKPPGIKMLTPSGRFQPDKKICFSMSDFHPGSWNPAWSVATILTGLLSFMLSDEMTTGSVTSSDVHKRAFAARSHGWNMLQSRFKDAFPDYCTPEPRDLPNMGERSRGKPDIPPPPATSAPAAIPKISTAAPRRTVAAPKTAKPTAPPATVARTTAGTGAAPGTPAVPEPGWAAAIWEKWRWGVFIALALLVSRMSSST
ncbi:hypothetical protein PLICRDRAFT_42784 [Plicaturopsis crispa FD-325 SS-3]|nr:hypothetical protein PLICRDRAFT_42784 [Plicaturopsis crispa FD-325 SS-3]